MMTQILDKHHCRILNYPTEVKVSEKRREKYWKVGEILPLKHKANTATDAQGFYLDASGERLTKNTKTAGKPRMLTINAQKIYVGIHHSVRSKIVNELHELFNTAFKAQLPSSIILNGNKVLVALHFYDIYTPKLPDLDNLANLFVKCGVDCLTTANNPNQTKGGATHKLAILPDDKMIFIPHILVEFTNVTKIEDRKLDFNIYVVEPGFSVEQLIDNQFAMDKVKPRQTFKTATNGTQENSVLVSL